MAISFSFHRHALPGVLFALAAAVHGATVMAAGDVTVTHLTSFHLQGEDVTTETGPKGWPSVQAPNAPPLLAVNPFTRRALLFGGFQGSGSIGSSFSRLASPGLYWLPPTPGVYERLEAGGSDLHGLIAGKPVASADGTALYGIMVSRYGERSDLLDASGNVAASYLSVYSKSVGRGIVFRTDPDGNNLTAVAASVGKLYTPNGALVIDAAGNLYGADKGPKGNGRVFKIGADGSFASLHEFDAAPGGRKQVVNDLILGSDGVLYGITGYDRGLPLAPTSATAPTTPVGTLYSIDPAAPVASFKVVHTFTLAEGEINVEDNVSVTPGVSYATGEVVNPYAGQMLAPQNMQGQGLASLVEGLDGWLYGTTSVPRCIVYSPSQPLAVTGYTSMAQQTPLCGAKHSPASSYSQAYPYYDGPVPHGAVYRIRKNGTTQDGSAGIQVLHRFGDTDGSTPRGPLAVGKDGAIYGTTLSGGANRRWVLLSTRLSRPPTCGDFALDAWNVQCLAAGAANYSRLQNLDQPLRDGVLYRIVPAKIAEASGGFELLHSFKFDVDGYRPLGVSAGSDGRLYGVSGKGGQGYLQANGIPHANDDLGTVFQVDVEGNVASATVRLVATPASIAAGQKATLTWTSFQAGSCTASSSGNDWTGGVATEGSIDLTLGAGTYRYQLTCIDTVKGGEVSALAQVYVDAVASVDDGNRVQYGNGGGGSLVWSLLPLLAMAGVRRRRMATA